MSTLFRYFAPHFAAVVALVALGLPVQKRWNVKGLVAFAALLSVLQVAARLASPGLGVPEVSAGNLATLLVISCGTMLLVGVAVYVSVKVGAPPKVQIGVVAATGLLVLVALPLVFLILSCGLGGDCI